MVEELDTTINAVWHAMRMVQFPVENVLSQMAKEGRITDSLKWQEKFAEVAKDVAAFQKNAPVDTNESDIGSLQ